MNPKDKICAEIQDIMSVYRKQEESGHVDSPGGLEHMGDVWRKLARWDRELKEDHLMTETPAKTTRELELEELLRSACAIAQRKGEGTHWQRFIESVNRVGLSGITARTYRILESDEASNTGELKPILLKEGDVVEATGSIVRADKLRRLNTGDRATVTRVYQNSPTDPQIIDLLVDDESLGQFKIRDIVCRKNVPLRRV